MADPIACLKLALTPNILLNPFGTPDTVQQCLTGSPHDSTLVSPKDVGEAVLQGALALIPLGAGAGKLARNAARFGAKAAAKSARIHRPHPVATSSTPCTSPIDLGLRLLSGVLFGPSSVLISPLGTPNSLTPMCEPQNDPLLQSAQEFLNYTSDAGADFLMDTFGPKPALWLAETFGL